VLKSNGDIPSAPRACVELLNNINFDCIGKRCTIIGDSFAVGTSIALQLRKLKATTTICNSFTANLKSILKESDLVVVGIGKPNYIKADWLKPDSIVLDVGINVHQQRIVGDVDYKEVKDVVQYITPVPGGIGPITVSMLLSNVYNVWHKMNFQECGPN
jgi:5,10-methylene-tetrahydrofolate dehydrogenase/methenyl tetrahydrofolate cyclohydrolase